MSELTEERVREIAREEAGHALGVLREEIERTGMRADGAMNQRDLRDCLADAEKEVRGA